MPLLFFRNLLNMLDSSRYLWGCFRVAGYIRTLRGSICIHQYYPQILRRIWVVGSAVSQMPRKQAYVPEIDPVSKSASPNKLLMFKSTKAFRIEVSTGMCHLYLGIPNTPQSIYVCLHVLVYGFYLYVITRYHTVDGQNPKQPPGIVLLLKPCKSWDFNYLSLNW